MYLLIWSCMSSKVYSGNDSCPSFFTCLHCSLGLAPSTVLYGTCFLLNFSSSKVILCSLLNDPMTLPLLHSVCLQSQHHTVVPKTDITLRNWPQYGMLHVPLKHDHNSLWVLELLKRMDEILGKAGHLTEELILGSILNELTLHPNLFAWLQNSDGTLKSYFLLCYCKKKKDILDLF